jgi:hypothetical protein
MKGCETAPDATDMAARRSRTRLKGPRPVPCGGDESAAVWSQVANAGRITKLHEEHACSPISEGGGRAPVSGLAGPRNERVWSSAGPGARDGAMETRNGGVPSHSGADFTRSHAGARAAAAKSVPGRMCIPPRKQDFLGYGSGDHGERQRMRHSCREGAVMTAEIRAVVGPGRLFAGGGE